VGINGIRANCSDFKGLRTISQMVYQPHAFEATTKGYRLQLLFFYCGFPDEELLLIIRDVAQLKGGFLWVLIFH
jgi:hypothetical protein